ncbi:hypothetical protein [Streptomyces gibsoniae]|uniref:MFS transporter n=1 Tax=Streptomyces gibsoniae TaxID=3075529 RepID=A0ABU2U2F9_9ACTN|nr:hypothetical protein [Streptomyces sp. DSM 41699]MDT0467402.1 hypothetical protein [Streptomyces sp. DSM 41699]
MPVLTLTGLGMFTPANNAMIMGAIPPGSSGAGGGPVHMTRGLGTALGVALVTLAPHHRQRRDPDREPLGRRRPDGSLGRRLGGGVAEPAHRSGRVMCGLV